MGDAVAVRYGSFGGNFTLKEPLTVIVPPTVPTLSEQTMDKVLLELSGHGFPPPTGSTRTGLRNLAEAFEGMAEGRLPTRHHLASLDPGVGKTTMVKHFLDCLLRSRHHDGVSAIVFVSRHDEIKKTVYALKELGHCRDVGVLVGKKVEERFAQLVDVPPSEARVLITTQQMLEQRCRVRRFSEIDAFQYRGSPRPVRIWDEAFMPGEEYSLSSDDLASLIRPARDRCDELAIAIEDLKDELKSATLNKRFSVPSMRELGGRSASAALYRIASDTFHGEHVRTAAQDLRDMAGEAPKVFANSKGIKTMLDYRDTIPSDLAPMVILDASGRCRHTYRLMEKWRENLVRLQEVTKDYSQLEIGVWPVGGGRSSFADDHECLRLRGIAETIGQRPEERWLLIHHKDRDGVQRFSDQLGEFLPPEVMERIEFLHWGDHHGTNRFASVENVILAGTLFLPSMIYEGRARLAAGMCDEDRVPPEVLRAVREINDASKPMRAFWSAKASSS